MRPSSTRIVVGLLSAVLLVSSAGCTGTSEAPAPNVSPDVLRVQPVSASLTMTSPHPSEKPKRLTYTLTVPGANLEAGSDGTVTVTVANSTDATQSSSAYYRVLIADPNGKVLVDSHPSGEWSLIRAVLIGPGETYRHEVPFLVPSPGVYIAQLPNVYESQSHSSIRLAVAFESVEKVRSTDRSSDATIGPLALGQDAKVGPYEVVLKAILPQTRLSAHPLAGRARMQGHSASRIAPWLPVPNVRLTLGVEVRNPERSKEASLPIPAYDTFTLIDRSGRSWEASGGVSLQMTEGRPKPAGPSSSRAFGFAGTVLRPGDYVYVTPIFYVPADARDLMLIYRPLAESPGKAVEFVIGLAGPPVPPGTAN
jgi:hypothetical protein